MSCKFELAAKTPKSRCVHTLGLLVSSNRSWQCVSKSYPALVHPSLHNSGHHHHLFRFNVRLLRAGGGEEWSPRLSILEKGFGFLVVVWVPTLKTPTPP